LKTLLPNDAAEGYLLPPQCSLHIMLTSVVIHGGLHVC